MTIILGIDPGLQKTGWGIISCNTNNLKFLGCGTIHTNSKDEIYHRLFDLNKGIEDVIAQFQPDICAIEETFVNKNPASSLKLGHARGALLLSVSLAKLPCYEYAARLVKKSVVGVGSASKDQIKMMVKQLLPTAQISSEDAADALAVAICHTSHKY